MRLVVLMALTLAAAAAGAVVGWQLPWAGAAISAAVFAALGGGLWWLRERVNAIRKQQQRTQRLLETRLESLERLHKATAVKAAAAEKAQLAEVKHAYRSVTRAIESRTNTVSKLIERAAEREADRSRRQADRLFRQLEALQNLHQLIEVRGAMPPSRGWALSPDVLLDYVQEVLNGRPRLVLECGSGASTVWAAYAVQRAGSGRVVALEHETEFLDRTREALAEHGLSELAEVRYAPLAPVELPAGEWQWYDTEALKDLHEVDLVLIDGPPKSTQDEARYPAVPALRDALAPGAVLLLDDADRPDEQAILERWLAEWPEMTWTKLPHEKGTARLVVPRA